MEGLTVGRMVHYVSYGTPGGEFSSEHRAAIVTLVERDINIQGMVSLAVLNPTGMFFNQHVPFNEDGKPGTWHWIEHV